LPALRYAIMLNGVTRLIMTKPDVLSGFDTVRVCTHYIHNGVAVDRMPFDIVNNRVEPVYKDFHGWEQPVDQIKDVSDLPSELSSYVSFIESELGVPVVIVSVGPDRKQTLIRIPEFA
jgi:adenylosuccinate synthase